MERTERRTERQAGESQVPTGPAKWVCWILGAVFVIVALIGFFGGEYVFGIFQVNTLHNWVHLLSGVVLLGLGFAREATARLTCWVFAAIYLLVTIIGFLGIPFVVEGLHLNMADNWLHLLLTLILGGGALASHAQERAGVRDRHRAPAHHQPPRG